MALPTPTCPLVIPASFSEVRGNQAQDPLTKSVKDLPITFQTLNVCDDPEFIKFRASISINELIDCKPVQAGNLSISGSIPACGKGTDAATLIDYLKTDIVAALPTA